MRIHPDWSRLYGGEVEDEREIVRFEVNQFDDEQLQSVIEHFETDMPKPGGVVDCWLLDRRIGRGGNASVWEARRSYRQADDPVALKILNATNPRNENFRRFLTEVDLMLRVNDPAVLPLLDTNITPGVVVGSNQLAWLAMPIAQPIRRHVDGKMLHEIVRAVSQVAGTLDRLASHEERTHLPSRSEAGESVLLIWSSCGR